MEKHHLVIKELTFIEVIIEIVTVSSYFLFLRIVASYDFRSGFKAILGDRF